MKFEVYDVKRDRYLTEEELEGNYFYNGVIHDTTEGSYEDIEDFKVNLATGKIQIPFDPSICGEEGCCGSFGDIVFIDSDDFEIEINDDV